MGKRATVAQAVHEELDSLAEKFTYVPDELGHAEGDYTNPIDRVIRDLAIPDIEAASDRMINAVVAGVTYYVFRRIVNYRAVNVSHATGIGTAGRRELDWNNHIQELRQIQKTYLDEYVACAAAVGVSLTPGVRATDPMVLIQEEGVGQALIYDDVGIGLPWFREGFHEEDDR